MRWIFRGTGAFIGRVESETRIAFWADEPTDHGFDPELLITVDLSRTPNAALLGDISFDAVEVDDCFSGPNGDVRGTTLGPRWPELQMAGAVYLEDRFYNRIPAARRPPIPPTSMGGRPYEYTSVLYWPGADPRAGRRYSGHHAEILEQRASLARIAVYPPGSSDRLEIEPKTMWVDLASPDQVDAGIDGLTQIGNGVTRGAVFLLTTKSSSELLNRSKGENDE